MQLKYFHRYWIKVPVCGLALFIHLFWMYFMLTFIIYAKMSAQGCFSLYFILFCSVTNHNSIFTHEQLLKVWVILESIQYFFFLLYSKLYSFLPAFPSALHIYPAMGSFQSDLCVCLTLSDNKVSGVAQ